MVQPGHSIAGIIAARRMMASAGRSGQQGRAVAVAYRRPGVQVRLPVPLVHGVKVSHVLVSPLTDRINVQLLGPADDGLVVVGSAIFGRAAAAQLVQAVAAGLEDPSPGTATVIVG